MRYSRRHQEGILSGVSAGVFLILLGAIVIMTPNLINAIVDFFNDFQVTAVPNIGNAPIYLPAPAHVAQHRAVYAAARMFSLIWGSFLILFLAARFAIHSPPHKKAENIGDIVFWFGAWFIIQTYLIDRAEWFVFWAVVIVLIGASLVIRGIALGAYWATRHERKPT